MIPSRYMLLLGQLDPSPDLLAAAVSGAGLGLETGQLWAWPSLDGNLRAAAAIDGPVSVVASLDGLLRVHEG